ncbi:ATP-binding protein [Brevundimonas kwangchunensis]|uniref:ATP-binding protein n=1 Tax=Brevundimonas kwangchunensis TaxID=322163 RepID=UPI0031DF8FC2
MATETLLNYYREPDRYQWVQVESTDPAFKAVDDVVACRQDGRFEVTQVKFAADPDNPDTSLCWEWLLTHKARGKSLLRHWSDSVAPLVTDGRLAFARLKTDRKPDSEFAKCLIGNRVSYSKIPAETRKRVVDQLGSAANAKLFFQNFDFIHSQPHVDDLDQQLWDRISSDTDPAGWAFFQKQVRLWSINKGLPKPDGKIKHLHLRHAFAVESAKPIAQGFKVPADYQIPDQGFADSFADRVLNNDGATVLWAPPGRGKSTFLSKFKAAIDPEKTVCIRHHYFLSLDDRSEARFFFQAIARSFEAQLDELIPDLDVKRQSVGDMLTMATQRVVGDGKRLVVIIDGLDHVWREGQSRLDTEELFNTLLPVIPGMHVVVGTQKIAEEHLPAKLLRAAPVDGWWELPLMNRAAVRGWITEKYKSGRLNLRRWHHEPEIKALNAVSDAFFELSAGLPLHLIYSFEAVSRDGEEVSPEIVQALPSCPSGDIRDYYATFLTRLSPRGRVILHVLAGLDFAPPPFAIADCLGNDEASIVARSEISHLLDYRELEVRPFHGSLFAYLHERPEHLTTFLDHSQPTLEWLRDKAPDYWRQTWLWVTEAKRGDADNLIAKPDRAWAVQYVSAGYPIDNLVAVYDHAERAAFNRFDLASLARLRLQKIRAINGPEFQTDDFSRLWATAASLNGDGYAWGLLRADLARLPAKMLPPLVRMTTGGQRYGVADRAIEELNGRITRSGANGSSGDRQAELAEAIVSVVGNAGRADVKRVLSFCKRAAHPDHLLAAYAQSARLVGDHASVFAAGRAFGGRELAREVFISLCVEGLAPNSQDKLKSRDHPAIRCLAIVKGDKLRGSSVGRDLSTLFSAADGPETRFQIDIRGMAYTTFMSALASALQGKSVNNWARIPSYAADSWLAGSIRAFEKLAGSIAARWLQDRQWPTLDDVFGGFDASADYGRGFDAQNRFIAIRLALIDAAFDIALIGRAIDGSSVIDAAALAAARSSDFWLDELWLEQLAKQRVAIHDQACFEHFADAYGNSIDQQVSVINERTINWSNLAMAALDHGSDIQASHAVQKAVEGIFAYGWRKDPFADEILDVLDMLIEAGEEGLKSTLLDLAGAFHEITDYTDGDGTNHIRGSYYELIAKHFPDKVGPIVNALIDDEEWRYVEDLYKKALSLPLAQTDAGAALATTYIMPTEHAALEKLTPAPAALDEVERKLGRNNANPKNRDRYSSSGSSSASETPADPPKIEDFPPGELKELLAERSRLHIYDRSGVRDWLAHWDKEGRGREALDDLQAIISETRLHLDLESGLDQAAEMAAKLDGRTRAFDWIVRAHVVRYGWQTYWTSSSEAEARLDVVARDYKSRWKDFVRQTMKPAIDLRESQNGIVVPFTRLVYLLIALGEMELAKAHADAMISAFKAEVSNLPLGTPAWA